MNSEIALNFLKNHQPLPSDENLTKSLLDDYDEVRKYFIEHPNKQAISLFLNSFGEGDGLGVYQLIEDVVRAHNIEDVIPHLNSSLVNGSNAIQYWCAQIAANFPDERLLEGLLIALDNESADTREAAIIALEGIGGESVNIALKERLSKEEDCVIRELIKDILDI